MRIIEHKTDYVDERDPKTAFLIREVKKITKKFSFLLPKGWRFIIVMERKIVDTSTLELRQDYYKLDLQADEGGGSYAEAKISTLMQIRDWSLTGKITFPELLYAINCLGFSSKKEYKKICNEGKIEMLSKESCEWLRDEVKITPYCGGIKIPYFDDIVKDDNKLENENGNIFIAFSGASQEQDLFFALAIFNSLVHHLLSAFPEIAGFYELSELKDFPAANLWIKLLGIEEC